MIERKLNPRQFIPSTPAVLLVACKKDVLVSTLDFMPDETAVTVFDEISAFETWAKESGAGETFGLACVPAHTLLAAPRLLATLRRTLTPKGVLVIPIEGEDTNRFLANEEARTMLPLLSESAMVVLHPRKYLDGFESPGFFVARPDDFTIRSYRDGDEILILDLFEVSFHQRREVAHWLWEYRNNPAGGPYITLAFDSKGELVAHYAGYPVRLWSDDPVIKGQIALQIGDTMTARWVRQVGRGPTSLVVRCSKDFFARYSEKKVAFNFGFNTGNIHKISASYVEGFSAGPVGYRTAVRKHLAARCSFSPFRTRLRGYSVERVTEIDDAEWNSFFERAAQYYGSLVHRDAEYVRWRYLSHPASQYEILTLRARGRLVGWCVFRRVEEKLVWGDALFESRHADATRVVVSEAIRSEFARDTTNVVCWFPTRPAWWNEVLEGLGLEISEEPNRLEVTALAFNLAQSQELLESRFYYTACDSDLY